MADFDKMKNLAPNLVLQLRWVMMGLEQGYVTPWKCKLGLVQMVLGRRKFFNFLIASYSVGEPTANWLHNSEVL